ncbi:unnamed protein product [Rhizopus stolonifer]
MAYNPMESKQFHDLPFSQSFSQPLFQLQASISPKKTRTKNQQKVQKINTKDVTLYKTELCRNWIELGACRYGDKCRYAHGEEEMRSLRRHARYKTEICRSYHSDGTCPYGTRCTYIHDLDSIPEQPTRSPLLKKDMNGPSSSLESLWKSKLGFHLESTKQNFPIVPVSSLNSLWFNDESASETSFSGDENTLTQSPLFNLLGSDSPANPTSATKYNNKPSFSVPFFFNKANSMWM